MSVLLDMQLTLSHAAAMNWECLKRKVVTCWGKSRSLHSMALRISKVAQLTPQKEGDSPSAQHKPYSSIYRTGGPNKEEESCWPWESASCQSTLHTLSSTVMTWAHLPVRMHSPHRSMLRACLAKTCHSSFCKELFLHGALSAFDHISLKFKGKINALPWNLKMVS